MQKPQRSTPFPYTTLFRSEEERNRERRYPRGRESRQEERDEGADAEAGDRQQPLRDAREAERRQRVPERRVDRRPRAQRQDDRNDDADPKDERETVTARREQEHQTGE